MKKDRRKRYRTNKYICRQDDGESLALTHLKQRWHDRKAKYIALGIQEEEEKARDDEKKKVQDARIKEAFAAKTRRRIMETDKNEDEYYAKKANIEGDSDTAPLLLDSVLTPVSEKDHDDNCSQESIVLSAHCKEIVQVARKERNQALMLARQYRNAAEECRSEKREMKHELERRTELVRCFWRDKIVEGGSRSGRILRAALMRK